MFKSGWNDCAAHCMPLKTYSVSNPSVRFMLKFSRAGTACIRFVAAVVSARVVAAGALHCVLAAFAEAFGALSAANDNIGMVAMTAKIAVIFLFIFLLLFVVCFFAGYICMLALNLRSGTMYFMFFLSRKNGAARRSRAVLF